MSNRRKSSRASRKAKNQGTAKTVPQQPYVFKVPPEPRAIGLHLTPPHKDMSAGICLRNPAYLYIDGFYDETDQCLYSRKEREDYMARELEVKLLSDAEMLAEELYRAIDKHDERACYELLTGGLDGVDEAAFAAVCA